MTTKLLLALICLFLFACRNNKQEITADTCSTANVTYGNTISGIISTSGCLNCHGPSPTAGFRLETYQQVLAKATAQRNSTSVLYGALSHQNGFSPMPKGLPMLSSCNLAKMKAWIDAGMPE